MRPRGGARSRRWLWRRGQTGSLFEQPGGIGIDLSAKLGRLACELGLKFGPIARVTTRGFAG